MLSTRFRTTQGRTDHVCRSNYTHLYDFTAATQLDYQIDKKQVQKSLVTVGMVANPDSSMHGQKSMKQEHQFFRRDEVCNLMSSLLLSFPDS